MRTFYYRHRARHVFRQPPVQLRPQFRDLDQRPLPNLRYVVFFTPRSGSSYLTDLIAGAGNMGTAGEAFNHRMAGWIAGAMGARNLDEYVDKLLRARNENGVFGAEITWPDLLTMFHHGARFVELLQPSSYLWLTRRDIVSQAVSIMSLVQTGVAHTKTATASEIRRANAEVSYKGAYLKRVISRLVWAETQVERFFQHHQVSPLRLYYEDIVRMQKAEVLGQIADHLQLARPVLAQEPENKHQKLPGDKKRDFAQRFREENPRFLAKIASQRKDGAV